MPTRLPRLLLSLPLLLPLALGAQQGSLSVMTPAVAAAPSGFASERLARLDSMVAQLVADQRIPGAVVLIVQDGRVVTQKAFGYRDLSTRAPLRTDDIFRIASQTKALTSLAAMILWEEGKFSLDEPVSKYIPEFEKQTVMTSFVAADSTFQTRPARRRTTIRQLFTHTSGLGYADIGSDAMRAIYAKAGLTSIGREGDVLADKVRILGRLPLEFEPGERFNYSLSIDVLGRLVEIWSGMPLDRFLRTRVLDPLQMRDTWFELPADRRARLVRLHTEQDGKLSLMEAQGGMHPDFPARKVTYFAGGAGLAGTIGDYARFLQMLLNGGELDGVRIIGRKTVEMMLTNQIPGLDPAYGLGFALETPQNDYRTVLSSGSFSWGGAFETTYWADPKERMVALIYTNILGSTARVGDLFKTLVYSAMR